MSKRTKKILAMLLLSSMTLSLAACGKSGDNNGDESAKKQSYGEVWSLPTTEKILRDQTDYANKGPAELNYHAVKNEYESYQLYITAEKDISSFELQVADLKNGDEVFSAENIDVYVQKYVKYNDSSGEGYAPDPLIPMAAAAEHKENKIKAGENGGLWITVHVPKETVAGVYEGTFKLTVTSDKKESVMDIPVSVEVYDYTLTDEVHAETLFSWRYDQVAAGEMDGSEAMMTYYYEFVQDYRISMQSLPVEALTAEEYIEDVLHYYDRLSSYTILTTAGSISAGLQNLPDVMKMQIFAIAEACTEDRNLFDKAIIYSIDEPKLDDKAARTNVINQTKVLDKYLQECIDTIKADKTGKYSGLKKHSDWETSIREIPNIMPIGRPSIKWMLENQNTEDGKELLETLNCICPLFPNFEDARRDGVIKMCEDNDIELWWYGCVSNIEPTPTYFVGDENLLSSRAISWLQKKYDIVGNLYWDVAGYTGDNASTGYFVEFFEWPDRDRSGGWQTGDGNLLYPGAGYGVYGPLPSVRIMSIRDGMEEYELLLDIENTLKEQKATFGDGFSVDTAMEIFYSTLAYDGVSMNKDGENALDFVALRKELLQLATNLKKGLGFAMGNITVNNGTATFEYFAQPGTTIAIDGEKQSAVSGQKYSYVQNLEESTSVEVTVTNADGKTAVYRQFIATPKYILSDMSEQSVMSGITVSDGSLAEFVSNKTYSTDGTSVHFKVNGKWSDNMVDNLTFVPSASIATSLFGDMKVADFDTVNVDVFNPGADFTVKVRLYSGSAYVDVGTYTVGSGKSTILLGMTNLNFSQSGNIDRIAFEFENAENASYEFYVDHVFGEK